MLIPKEELEKWPWGDVIKVHSIGEYDVVEYMRKKMGYHDDEEGIHFHPYIYGKDTNHTYESMDAALVGAIAYQAEGPNHRADVYFMRAILNE